MSCGHVTKPVRLNLEIVYLQFVVFVIQNRIVRLKKIKIVLTQIFVNDDVDQSTGMMILLVATIISIFLFHSWTRHSLQKNIKKQYAMRITCYQSFAPFVKWNWLIKLKVITHIMHRRFLTCKCISIICWCMVMGLYREKPYYKSL